MHKKTIYKQGLKKDILNSKNLSEIFESKLSLSQKNGRYFFDEINEN